MKDGVSVEHMLPQEWQWDWTKAKSESERESLLKKISGCINGIGNLLLLTRGENSSAGNQPPSEKRYDRYALAGSYKWHDEHRKEWEDSDKWEKLIIERGEDIYDFILRELVDPEPIAGFPASLP